MAVRSGVLGAVAFALIIAASAPAWGEPPAPSVVAINELLGGKPAAGPGCVVGVLQEGQVAYRGSFGFADAENRTAFTGDSAFNIGSMSKQFTALAVLLLAEDGKLKLDDDVRRYIPELPGYGVPVTVRELLTQTSGERDSNSLMYLWGRRYMADRVDQREAIAAIARQRRLNFPPGSEFSYSNSNYQLAAEVVSRVSGQPFSAFMQARIFGPLRMTRTVVVDGPHVPVPGRVQGYMDGATRVQWPNFTVGDSNIFSTLDDLAKWDQNFTLAKVGTREDLEAMSHAAPLADGSPNPYAMGLYRTAYRGQVVIEHDGAVPGFVSELMRLPELSSAVAVLCNDRHSVDPDELARRVADVAFLGGAEPRKPSPQPGVPFVRPDEVAGAYWSDEAHAFRRFAVVKGQLVRVTTNGGVISEEPQGPHAVREGSHLFDFRPGGVLQDVASPGVQPTSSREAWIFQRMPEPDLSPEALDAVAGDYCSDEVDARWSFARVGSRLVLRRHGRDDEPLTPLFANAFREDDADLIFDRPPAGRAKGFVATNPRLGSVPFYRCTY